MSIAWRAILVAGLAAGEEATLASLTGLFQREPERAAALVASAREGARAINGPEDPPRYASCRTRSPRGGTAEASPGTRDQSAS